MKPSSHLGSTPQHIIGTMAMLPLLLTVCLNSRLVVAGSISHPRHLSREMEEVILPATTTSAATVCTTEEQCRQQFSTMSTSGEFLVGDFPTKGCFSKNGNVYFGIGSVVDEDMAETDLPGTQERIWCISEAEVSQSTTVPTMQPSSEALLPTIPPVDDGDGSFFFDVTGVPTLGQQSVQIPGGVCLTVDQCQRKFSSMSTGGEFIVGEFPTKGCFSKNINIYFGTGSTTEEELAETELPGTQERIWCDGATEVPTTNPSVLRVTDSPSTQPTRMPVVLTASPSIQPTTGMPVTASPTKQLNSMPVTESPTSTSSSVLEEGTAPPSQLPINSTSPTLHSIIPPSVSPTTVSPITMAPSVDTVQETNDLSSQHKPTTSPTKAKTNSVTLTSFELSLQTAPGTNTVDTLELKDLVSIHLLETMEAALKSFETTKLDMNVTSISGQPSRRLQPSGLIFASDNTTTNTLDFTLSGIAYFSGSSVPSVKALDSVTLESFSGKSGDEFVHSLQNAEDAGLRSTRSVDAEISNNEEVNIVNQLTQAEDDDEVGNKRLSLLAIVFGVGLLLVAMHVMKSRRARKVELENRENAAYDDVSVLLELRSL